MKSTILESCENFIRRYWILSILISVQIFIIGSLLTCNAHDPSWLYQATNFQGYKNIFGAPGAACSVWLIYLFGRASLVFAALCLYLIFLYFYIGLTKKIKGITEWDRALGVIIGFATSSVFCQIYLRSFYDFAYPGGMMGRYLLQYYAGSFDLITQQIIVWALLMVSAVLILRCSYFPLFSAIFAGFRYCLSSQNIPARSITFVWLMMVNFLRWTYNLCRQAFQVLTGAILQKLTTSIVQFEQEKNVDADIEQVVYDLFWQDYVGDEKPKKSENILADVVEPNFFQPVEQMVNAQDFIENDHDVFASDDEILDQDVLIKNSQIKEPIVQQIKSPVAQEVRTKKTYQLPFLPVKKIAQAVIIEKQEALVLQSKLLEEKLAQFDIKGAVVGMHSGPVVTLFEYQPDIKVKVSRILALEDDLAMALKALSIRIIAPIPGRSVVGFEVANRDRQDVILSTILQSPGFKQHKGALPMVFGQDTLGNDVIADLAKMPHLLIAGSTGSGKSVALNAMLVSLLCALKPQELQLIIIDPKRLEFAAYDGIAHLIFPIVTDTKKAIPILKWVVQTMEQRYQIMAQHGVRNLSDYKIAAQQNPDMQVMPLMVVIIDELADLMMTAGKAVEESIARIAQMARAAGIHMIIATQRPSVDVITGMIKVNFPNRVAFKVTSKIDSRTILDASGAEKLLGRGDMLFLDTSKSHLTRVHGAYISDQEIHDVVSQIKQQGLAKYITISEQFESQEEDDFLDGDDTLFQEILQVIKDLDEVSISMLQRRFRIGYNRSARMISILESKGMVVAVQGGKMRRVVKF